MLNTVKNNKIKSFALVVGIVILIYTFFVATGRKAEAPSDAIGIATSTPIIASEIVVEKSVVDEKEYHLEISTPQIKEPGNSFAQQLINKKIKESIEALIKDFRFELESLQELRSGEGESVFSGNDLPKHSLIVSVAKADYVHNKYLAVELKDYSYISGSAHPFTRTVTLNYDLKTGDLVDLERLTNNQERFLVIVSNIAKMNFEQKLSSFFPDGVLPKPENFQVFTIEDKGIRFVFDQYQVAPYAVGEQELLVEYGLLSGLLNIETN